jgi:hypothetical protein
MRIIDIDKTKPDRLEVKWMWLPTFIGQNSHLLQMLDKAVMKEFPPPYEATDEKLDEIHEFVINWFEMVLRVPGLAKYLRAIEMVPEGK